MSSNCRCIFHWKLSILILLSVWHLPSTSGQGYFPNLVDLAVLKPISSSSTCGATSSRYCQSSTRASSLQICEERTCKFDCCSSCGDSKPVARDLAEFSSKQGVTQDGDPRNGSNVSSFRFQGNSVILPLRVPAITYVNPGFTVSVWIKQKARNKGTIISKDETLAPNFANVYQLVIQDYNLMFFYRPTTGNASVTVYNLLQSQSEKLQPDEWHLITVTVIDRGLSYYIDGELMNANYATLMGPISDQGGTVRIGQKYGGLDQYEGFMQDILMYDRALTNREAIELFTGVLPSAYVASNCRCPPTHPKINAAEPAKCLKNLEGNATDSVSRLADTAHPIEFATDGDTLSFWLSEITENVTIDINLKYTGFQVFYIVLTFYGPLPGAITIERSTDSGSTFQPWQYFAEDCVASFNLQNNGPLSEPDSVNCIQYIKPLQSSQEALTFQTEYPPPPGSNIPVRPFGQGCSNLYCSEKLLQFLKATHVRLHFVNHTLVQNPEHRYYGLQRILVTGRCECFGHASTFFYIEGSGNQIGRCVCNCQPSTNTEGENCHRCKPLYNNKPFLRGDRDNANPCIKCECNDHANSCIYNQTLDTNPNSRTHGGGGVCIDCQHNTTGRYCEMCKEMFYRESGKSLKARDVCTPCGCEGPGVQPGKLDCVKDDSNSSVLAGQCECKAYTVGRECDQCKDGFYDLKASHATGCVSCGCVLDGTQNRNISCDSSSGQCYCKDRVTGRTCNTCTSGYWGLSGQDALGCKTCDCDPFGTTPGSVNTCNSTTGQCSCKQGVIGRKCDQCADGYHTLTQNGCTSCNCSLEGTPPSLLDKCNKNTGVCSCKLNVEGNNCDRCKSGFFNLSQSNPQGCEQCACDTKGTVGGSGQCNQQSGNCTCKPLVIGQRCNQCKVGTFGLNQSNPNGCEPCNCFPKGTIDGDRKSPDELQCSSNGQCPCLSSVTGLRCDSCVSAYYWNPSGQGCVECRCNNVGSVGRNCNDTGYCTCKANIGGRQCDRCIADYYGFTVTGSCIACNCSVAGSLLSQCDESGKCTCKQNVEGNKCDQCKSGTVNLQQNNKYGCSGAPSEQPAPFATVLSPRFIMLTWSPPDNPNGIIIRYELYRNGTQIYSGLNRTFNDTSLTPDTVYYYYIITYTESGNTRSLDDGRVYRTFQDAPGGISPPSITNILPRNVTASWQLPSSPNGRVIDYRLISTSSRSSVEVIHCRGIIFTCDVGGLTPYTVYNFSVEACTNGGCGRSNVTTIVTAPTLPDFQPAPNVTSFPGGKAVEVEWDEPPEPNGRILRYELYMRSSPFQGVGTLKYNSNPAHDSNPVHFRKTNVTGLQPFTEYEFRVITTTAQVSGDRASDWTRHRTGEGTPLGESAMNPSASPFNSSAVLVSWSPPQNPQGIITRYIIYKYQPPSNATAVEATVVTGSQRQGMVDQLQPYTEYKFTVRACNSYDCSGHGAAVLARTKPSAPEGQSSPEVFSVDSSIVYLNWSQPQTPNGPLPPSYNVSRAYSALHHPPPLVTSGVHFPGLGYYKFPSDFVRVGAENNIELWFRTQYAFGLILFLVSDGSQTDMLAVQLRDGKPWLIFDSQDGPAAFTISESARFDDNLWHNVKINRKNRRGTLTVDSYSASQDSPGSTTVISADTGVYIGGLPPSFVFFRPNTGNSEILRHNFVGCLRGITSESQSLDWTSALEAVGVEPQRNGCPARDKKKAVFLRGGGYIEINRQTTDVLQSNIFSFTLNFRTQLSSGLLLFAHGATSWFAIQFADNQVATMYSTSSMHGNLTIQPSAGEICDGRWHNLTVTNFQVGQLNIKLDNKNDVTSGISNLLVQSVYVGGVPWGSQAESVARQAGVNVATSFGGCIKVFSAASEIDYQSDVMDMYNADLDGCLPESTIPVSRQRGSCLLFNSSVVYSGKNEKFNDSSVETFTDYLYRVESYHAGTTGSAKSAWIATRSGQGAPTGLQAPIQLIPLPGGTEVRVAWAPPARPNGVLTEYRILSYRVHPPQAVPVEKVVSDTGVLNTTVSGLQPYTIYEIKIQAFTVGGSSVGPGKNVTTEESVPAGVQGPSAVRRPRELDVSWAEPAYPNGIIILYNLTLDGQLVYSGSDNNFTISNLEVYTEYALQLTACTRIGCAQGPMVRIRTGELPPEGVKTPRVIVRGRTEVEVNWEVPSILNGAIVRYEVLFATSDVLSAYVSKFNATPNVFSTVVRNLTAGTLYFVRVRPFTGGGGTFSNASQVRTHEDIPDDIPAPTVVALSPYALYVIILKPDKPNGIITRYELYQDSIVEPVLNETQLSNYTASGFTPYSRHTFRVRACTAQGCAYGAVAVAFTQEIAPNGTVALTASIRNATAVNARWTRVGVPNGRLFYNLMIQGSFIVPGSAELRTEERVETGISVEEAEKDFVYNGLIPFNNYTFWVNASNSVGFILSNNVTGSTPEGVPGGLKAPNVTVLSSTSVHVSWEPPALPNGIILGYGLHQSGVPTVLFSGLGFSFTVTNLQPFTIYEFRVNASTIAGSGFSPWSQASTFEDVPSAPDPPVFRDVASTSLTVKWDPPDPANGVLLRYVIYQNGTEIARVTGNITSYRVTGLQPYTVYVFRLSVCTAVGCSNSSNSAPQQTLESGPQGLSAPRLSSPTGRTVIIEWDPPAVPNGVILKYQIQRRLMSGGNPSVISEVNATLWRRYVDNTVQPLTAYQYRLIAFNSGPGDPSPYSDITTGQGDPEGIAAPSVQALSPYAINVKWTAPSVPNGNVTRYIIRVIHQQTSRNVTVNADSPFDDNVTELDPYILYNVIVSACTTGGCGSSSPSQVRTHPAAPENQPAPIAQPLSQTEMRVSWDPPIRPNGLVEGYVLFRRTVEDLVTNNISSPTEYTQVYKGGALPGDRVVNDVLLGIYSLQQYKVTVTTAQGNTTSNPSLPYRTNPAPPLAGPTVNGTALNHTTLLITWYPPEIKQLRGAVVTYIVDMAESSLPGAPVSRVGQFPGNRTSVTVKNLKANTYYTFYVELNNGAGTFKSDAFRIRTLDGMPEGFGPPTLYTINSTAIRVSWSPPTNPNGNVILYKIYVNDTLWINTSGDALQVLVSGLQPYTYYVIKVAVCTTHGCTMSDARAATTNSAAPTGFAAPRLKAGSTFIEVRWEPPTRPNGIMSGYQIFRRMVYQCPTSPPPQAKCTFIECRLSEQLCGVTCYNPGNQICCNGVLYSRDPAKTCCGTNYLRKNTPSDVCCGNTFHIQQSEYQCCHGDYIRVPSGSVCCRTSQGGRVVGLGNACCGDTPYNSGGSKVCVCGALYDPIPPRKCCGGSVVASAQVCCGDEVRGAAYDLESSNECCGTQYVPKATSLCCKGSTGDVVVYNYTSAADKSASSHKCCGKRRVDSSLSCCSEQGYNSSYQTCASKASNGTVGCGMGTICNKTDANVAMCDRCDFDNTTLLCGYVPGYYDLSPTTAVPRVCATGFVEILNNQYNPNLRFYNDTNLSPHTLYEYYLVAINNVGNASSPVAQNRTLMGRPAGLSPPVAVAISSSEVRVTWSKPTTPNGVIGEYRLTRINGQTGQRRLVFSGLNVTFIDRALEPFTGYRYVIEACTTQCASAEMTSLIYTDQAAPAYVNATILLPVNYSAINVTWMTPPKPNGDIIRYNVSRVVNSTFKIRLNPNDKGLGMSLLIGGLQPYTNYTFEVIACTKVGCTASPLASTRTLQAPPEGVRAPNLTVTGAREIEATWTEPDILNGVIVKYSLFRGNLLVYNGTDVCYKNNEGKDVCIFQDQSNGLQPVTTYSYSVSATTGGGTTRSGVTTATTPESSPEAIPKPRLAVQSAYSILAEWDEPGQPNGNITGYAVVVNGTEYDVGLNKNRLITGLNPFTVYSVRVKACTAKGCGLGDREYATTNEAAPIGQGAPTLVAQEWNIVQISWSPPSSPNGIITRYEIYRRVGSGAPLVVCVTTQLTCLNSGLLGYTEYSYRVRVRNSAGSVYGPWRNVRTLEGPPQGISPPSLNVLNSTAIYVSWTAPSQPNGIVTHYEVRYREELQVPGNANITVAARVASNVRNITVNGLKPYTDYQFLIAAINSRREGTSAWAIAKTRQAPPADLRPVQADKAADGKSMRLFWDEPGSPNGLITHYNLYQDLVQIYRGAPREYRVSRLIPYTSYEFQLEACTVAGCTRGPSQVIFSAEINPQGQAPPLIGFKNATAIQLTWKPPVVPNGVIIRYEIYRSVTAVQSRRKRAVAPSSLVYSTNDTNQTDYQYMDAGLMPYRSYSYFVRVVNKGGSTDSDQVTVTTDQAPPASMDAPRVTSVDRHSLNVSWTKPREPNGVIQYYIVFRNDSVKHKKNELSFLDQGLDPYTVYSYTVEACSGGGCTESSPSSLRTSQASPSGVHPPVLQALSAVAIRISWRMPEKPNGVITKYQLFQAGEDFLLSEGLAMSFDISKKEPYTKYSFYIKACTVAGCTQGPAAEVRTLEAKPEGLDAPTVTVGGSAFVRVEWNAPREPNGLILYYLITRNGSQVYNGTDLRFLDYIIAPFTVYAYVVTAVNSADRLSSPPGYSPPTNPGAPDNVSTATLEVVSPTSMKATWSVPGKPNGVITKYEVLYSFKGAQGNAQVRNAGLAKELTLTGLQPYTEYEVRIRACTKEGCSTGEAASARTHEAPPEGQSPPDFPSLHITARRVLVNWNEPQKPNGFMLLYRIHRRGYSLSGNQQQVYGPVVSVANVTNGSVLEFNDTTVKPYFRYQYRIISANSAGETESDWSVVQTLSASPEQLKAPRVNRTHSFSLEVLIVEPGTPNGEIRNYILEVSGENKSEGLTTLREVSGLEPFTVYVLRVYVCTDGGCALGPRVNWRTAEGAPAQFSAPRPVEINATTVVLEWDEPGKPNGNIQRYEVLYHESCAVGCPTGLPESGTNVGLLRRHVVRDLSPYTMYNFRIRVYNTLYSSLSDEQAVRTQASAPIVTNVRPRVNVSGFQVAVDWSESFILNGPLDTYELLENGLLTYEGPQTKRNLGTRNVGEYTYIAKATTLVQGRKITVTSPPSGTVQIQGEVGPGTTAPRTDSEEWYSSAWFIAVMALVAILILFILLALCLWRTSGNRTVYVRDREPLPPRTKLRSRPPSMSSLYTSSDRKNGSMIDMQPMPMPYYSSTTALYDSTERLNRLNEQYGSYRSGSGHKVPLDVSQDWDGYLKAYSRDRDSGLYDDEKLDYSDSEPGTPYQTFKREQYFTDTHL